MGRTTWPWSGGCAHEQASSGAWTSAVFVLGSGSNLLVADEGFDGMVLHLGAGFAGVELPAPEREGEGAPASPPAVVRAGAAVNPSCRHNSTRPTSNHVK